ncbi:hypothetical protein BDN70DRAFT_923280 [Pholiota conissans]|uniref:F-box domain-containing protein n=1 Tax=Pholiota conissans TaxID=109636 RepID=A0A9P5YVX0_9AGAR|nr:hypothetical protein BDN70DRAFT_923280 [Pholiota conissans]
MATLLDIPLELILKIFSRLDAKSLIRCAMASRQIYSVVEDSPLLRFIILSYFTGFRASGDTSLMQSFPDDLLRTLERRCQAWVAPQWTKTFSLKFKDTSIPLHCTSGIFSRQHADHLEITSICTEDFAKVAERTAKLNLQSQLQIRENNHWIDPSQDLLILIGENGPVPSDETRIFHIHLRTLSNNKSHPQAIQPFLQFSVPPNQEGNDIHKIHVEIARNMLMMAFNTIRQAWSIDTPKRILVWDWITADLILDSSWPTFDDPDKILRASESIVGFLDETHIYAMSTFHYSAVHLYEIVEPTINNPSPLRYRAQLSFPSTCNDIRIIGIYHEAGPLEAQVPPYHSPNIRLVNDDDLIHVFALEYGKYPFDGTTEFYGPFYVYVHQHSLMRYFSQHEGATLHIPWRNWGPPNARLIAPPRSSIRISAHGQRALLPRVYDGLPQLDRDGITVLDFSLASVMAAQGKQIPFSTTPVSESEQISERKSGTLLPPTTIQCSKIPVYTDDVETHLPCVAIDVEIQGMETLYMIDEDGLLRLNLCMSVDGSDIRSYYVVDKYTV